MHDTVAAIAREAGYRRSYTTSLFARLMDWIGRVWARILAPLAHLPGVRTAVLLAAVIAVLVLIARVVLSERASAVAGRRTPGAPASGAGPDPWQVADRLASAGQFTAAAHALYEALLLRLSTGGAVRLHPSKTAGDYARELRRGASAAHPPFQSFRVRYDHLIYGTGVCTAEDYAALVSEARPLLGRAA